MKMIAKTDQTNVWAVDAFYEALGRIIADTHIGYCRHGVEVDPAHVRLLVLESWNSQAFPAGNA